MNLTNPEMHRRLEGAVKALHDNGWSARDVEMLGVFPIAEGLTLREAMVHAENAARKASGIR
jgi:hypothetical protein